METQIIFVRHGTTEWMEQGILHGRLDSPLSALGINEAREAARKLKGQAFTALYSSPAGRAFQTAQIIGGELKLKPRILPGLAERDFGRHEGKPNKWDGRMSRSLLIIRDLLSPIASQGESRSALNRRARETMNQLLNQHSGEKLLLVSHSGFINTVLQILTQHPFTYYSISPAAVIKVVVDQNGKGNVLTSLEKI
jgi:probable phosphoglycerate mutase